MASRIYLVEFYEGEDQMVDASSQWQAIKHCVKRTVKARAATAQDVATFVTNGGKIEQSIAATPEATK